MMRRLGGAAIVIASMALCGSCSPPTDLGKDCILVKKDPADPSRAVQIKESDISANNNRDIISFGSVDCEDLVCVHEAGAALTGDANKEVHGTCSRSCAEGSTNSCTPADPNDQKDAAKKLSCRALLLDEATLASIKQSDPSTYKTYFGDTTSPFFCARDAKTETTNP